MSQSYHNISILQYDYLTADDIIEYVRLYYNYDILSYYSKITTLRSKHNIS